MELQYLTARRGWWIAHHNLPPTNADLGAYVAGIGNARIVQDGVVVHGPPNSECQECGWPHEGWSGSCLI